MDKLENKIKKKMIIIALSVLISIMLVLGFIFVLFGGIHMVSGILPTAYVETVQEYKELGSLTGIEWADMIIYDTVRYENDFDLADPSETAFEFFIVDYERFEKEYYCVEEDVEGNCIELDYKWVSAEKKMLRSKEAILRQLERLDYNTNNFDVRETINIFERLDKTKEYDIKFYSRDLEDLFVNLSEDEQEWANVLVSENFAHEMFGEVYDLPDHIPVIDGKFLAWPTPTLHTITSNYGWRVHPTEGTRLFHYGTDISGANAMGQPVISVADGEVIQVNYTESSTSGLNIRISHIDEEGNEWQSRYSHLSQINVKTGERVSQGDVVGAVGNTGRSTGPHLHFELRFGGQLVDPYPYIRRD